MLIDAGMLLRCADVCGVQQRHARHGGVLRAKPNPSWSKLPNTQRELWISSRTLHNHNRGLWR